MEAILWQLFAGNWWFQLGGFTNQILLFVKWYVHYSGSPSDIIIMISKKFCLTSPICQKLCFPRSLVEGFENYTGHRSYPIHNDLPTENTIRSDFHKSKKYNTAVKILLNWNADADFNIFLRYLAIAKFFQCSRSEDSDGGFLPSLYRTELLYAFPLNLPDKCWHYRNRHNHALFCDTVRLLDEEHKESFFCAT